MSWVGEFLGLGLVASVALLVVSTASLFWAREGAGRPASPARVALAAVVLGLAVWGGVTLAGSSDRASLVVGAALAVAVLVWLPLGSAWSARGVVAWAMTVAAGVSYLGYVAWWISQADLVWYAAAASVALWLLELFVFALALGYVWELVDVLARRRWDRAVDLDALDPSYRPFVSLHVPAHNEPPEMVIETLTALLELDYDDYEIVMIDDNTEDESLWRPVEAFCEQHERITFAHLENWPGYKSGALNYALTVTDPRAEVIGIVDSDYVVQPDWLTRIAPMFVDPDLSFVQTPQDYRDWELTPYSRRLYHSYAYFFDVSQRSRNESDAAIFGGTMGLIRREALESVGGWDEWCITEDAELSLRLLRAGWTGQHVNQSFGRGLMPLTFEALKRQRFRWCFGGIQILRMHGRSLMPWHRSADNRLSLRQRWGYLVGGLQWYGDLAGLLFIAFLLAGAYDLVTGDGLVVRRLSGVLLLALVVLILLGAVRSLGCLRRMRGASWGETLGAFGLWLGMGWAVAQGAFRGSFAAQGEFLRTPKQRGDVGWWESVRGNRTEVLIALVCLTGAGIVLSRGTAVAAVIGGLLLLMAVGHLAAPANSWAAIRSVSERERARAFALPSWVGPTATRRLVLWPAAAAAVFLVVGLSFASPADAPLGSEIADDLDGVEEPTSEPTDEVKPRRQRRQRERDDSPATSSPTPAPQQTRSPAPAPAPADQNTAAPAPAPADQNTPAPAPAPADQNTPAPAPAPAPAPSPDQPGQGSAPDRPDAGGGGQAPSDAPSGGGAGNRP